MCNIGTVVEVVTIPKEKAIIAYRSWNPGLMPLFHIAKKTKWKQKALVKSHAAPTAKNAAGLYCYKLIKERNRCAGGTSICGSIKIWGKVVIHQSGYRASNAEIVKITKGHKYLPKVLA